MSDTDKSDIESAVGFRLLEPGRYEARIAKTEGAIQRSLLVLVAIFAFYLAIEGSFARYEQLAKFESNSRRVVILQLQNRNAERELASTQLTRNDISELKSNIDTRNETIKLLNEQNKKTQDKMDELREQAISFSLIGTSLGSQLYLAPSLWFLAMGCWALYFTGSRQKIYKNLAFLHCAIPAPQRETTSLDVSGFILSSLPAKIICKYGSAERKEATKRDILDLVEMPAQLEGLYRVALISFVLACLIIAIRILYISIELSSEYARLYDFTPDSWPGRALAVLLFGFCASSLILAGWPRVAIQWDDSIDSSRRMALLFGVSALPAIIMSYGGSIRRLSSGFGEPERKPRFLSVDKKEERLANYRVTVTLNGGNNRMFISNGPKGNRASGAPVHFADQDGKVRLFSAANGGLRRVAQLSDDALIQGLISKRISSVRITQVEAVALARIEKGNFNGALRLLGASARRVLGEFEETRYTAATLDFRTLDLYAGLLRRRDRREELLALVDQVEKVVNDVSSSQEEKSRTLAMLSERADKWKDPQSAWQKRWSNTSEKIAWHHPYRFEFGEGNPVANQVVVEIS
ncbi:hypothetical protein [Rhizobium laguerreae]|uniref:Uncharacterized protein n=1 Tax=Rhizobium laguerreae TaxID=1076926 RepID=A0A6N9ZEQ3_9HYPH|nr:hypothetical protein [Rhizobium laguerreae]NEH91308.1 hypothetical protein [Rhizobium laguerreae]